VSLVGRRTGRRGGDNDLDPNGWPSRHHWLSANAHVNLGPLTRHERDRHCEWAQTLEDGALGRKHDARIWRGGNEVAAGNDWSERECKNASGATGAAHSCGLQRHFR